MGGVEIKLSFALWAAVSAFFKIAVFGPETCHFAKFQKLHMYSLSTPGGQKFTLQTHYIPRNT